MILGPQGPGKVGQRGGFFFAGVAQLVEHYLAKVDVASSNLVSRSNLAPHERGGLFHVVLMPELRCWSVD